MGVASGWDKRKDLDDLVKIEHLLELEYQVVLIGLASRQINDLPSSIIGIQQINNIDELAEWYFLADFFFNPTYEDSFPTTNLEAQSCLTPCFTYNTGGSPESLPKENVLSKGSISVCADKIKIFNVKFNTERLVDKKSMIMKYLEIL